MKSNLKKRKPIIGIASSLYLALAYLGGILIFIVILQYPSLTNAMDKLKLAVEMQSMFFLTNLLMYVLFGPVLVVFILQLISGLKKKDTAIVQFSAVVGYIWAGSLTASGMVANASLEPIAQLFQSNPGQALHYWQIIDSVSLGLGNGNGEILGGMMTLGFGIAQFKDESFSSGVGIFGIFIGVIGMVSILPPLVDLTAAFGILQLIWFVLTGFSGARRMTAAIK